MERTGVIIVAGGGGSRMGGTRPKQFLFLGGEPILGRTINNFAKALPGAKIVVVLPAEHTDFWRNLAARFSIAPHTVAEGGQERFHSVRNGLAALPGDVELIAVQDGVRPLGSRELILRMVAAAAEHDAAIPVIEAVDSFREMEPEAKSKMDAGSDRNSGDNSGGGSTQSSDGKADSSNNNSDADSDRDTVYNAVNAANYANTADNACNTNSIHNPASHIIDRRQLRIVQTPQVFRAELLRQAYEAEYQPAFTDDASVVELAGTAIHLCEGERANLKITTPEDLIIAEALLTAQNAEQTDGEHV